MYVLYMLHLLKWWFYMSTCIRNTNTLCNAC